MWYSSSSYFNKRGRNNSNFPSQTQEYSTQITVCAQTATLSIDSYFIVSLLSIELPTPFFISTHILEVLKFSHSIPLPYHLLTHVY